MGFQGHDISPAADFATCALYQLTPFVNVVLLFTRGGIRLVSFETEIDGNMSTQLSTSRGASFKEADGHDTDGLPSIRNNPNVGGFPDDIIPQINERSP
jgi:hypothetical protein